MLAKAVEARAAHEQEKCNKARLCHDAMGGIRVVMGGTRAVMRGGRTRAGSSHLFPVNTTCIHQRYTRKLVKQGKVKLVTSWKLARQSTAVQLVCD